MNCGALAYALGAGVVGALLGGCVLADPPATLPVVAQGAPSITSDVYPPEGVIAGAWPARFIIPVSLVDPTQPVKWLAYEDYNPYIGGLVDPLPAGTAPVTVKDDNDGGMIRQIVAVLPEPFGSGCHTVEIVIASDFGSDFAAVNPPGGVVAHWLFTADGSPVGCAGYDAGALADGTFPDSGREDATPRDGGI